MLVLKSYQQFLGRLGTAYSTVMCTVQCTDHCTVHFAVQWSAECTHQYTETEECTVHSMISLDKYINSTKAIINFLKISSDYFHQCH